MDAMPSSNLRPENEEDEAKERKAIYRTTYMFSATMPPAVERLARKYLRRPIVVTIGSAGRATDNVTQRVVIVKENEKASRLEQELDMVEEKRAIVFVNTKRQCDNVYSKLEGLGYRSVIADMYACMAVGMVWICRRSTCTLAVCIAPVLPANPLLCVACVCSRVFAGVQCSTVVALRTNVRPLSRASETTHTTSSSLQMWQGEVSMYLTWHWSLTTICQAPLSRTHIVSGVRVVLERRAQPSPS